ncbi:hypothetical protein GRJ2_002122500 [Grus japonensis]|uniref:Uncharacterized protein n=1 Tax=Grus japonensis TaxID=30415 RepID=A0ABC9XJ25_GRUJA
MEAAEKRSCLNITNMRNNKMVVTNIAVIVIMLMIIKQDIEYHKDEYCYDQCHFLLYWLSHITVQIPGLLTILRDPECCAQCASQPLQTTTRRPSRLQQGPAATQRCKGEPKDQARTARPTEAHGDGDQCHDGQQKEIEEMYYKK